MTTSPSSAETGLLLFAHGTLDGRGGAIAERVAGALRARGRFAEVSVCFSRQAPTPAEALGAMRSARVLVAPLLASEGRLMRYVLPDLLADAREPGRWRLLPPVGLNPGIAGIAADLIDAVVTPGGLDPRRTAVLVAGHGSTAGVGSQAATERLATGIAGLGRYGEIRTVYLSQEPSAAVWRAVTAARDVVAVPFFISGGHHEEEDLPALLRRSGNETDGTEAGGRRLWMTPAVGRHPSLVDLIEAEALALLADEDAERAVA